MSKHWTYDSFGDRLPSNWEEIVNSANAYIDERSLDEDEGAELWEDWCAEDEDILKVIPAARFEEEEEA